MRERVVRCLTLSCKVRVSALSSVGAIFSTPVSGTITLYWYVPVWRIFRVEIFSSIACSSHRYLHGDRTSDLSCQYFIETLLAAGEKRSGSPLLSSKQSTFHLTCVI